MLSVQNEVGSSCIDNALDMELSKLVHNTAACSSSLGIVAVDFSGFTLFLLHNITTCMLPNLLRHLKNATLP